MNRILAALLVIIAGLAVVAQAQPSDTRLYVPLVRVPEEPSATATATATLESTLTATPTATTLAPIATLTATSTATATSVVASPTATATNVPATPTRNPATCAAEYPTVCIPPPPPDLNCGDITFRRFTVLPPDRHNFDTDDDGIGCES